MVLAGVCWTIDLWTESFEIFEMKKAFLDWKNEEIFLDFKNE